MPSDTVMTTPNGETLVFNERFHSYKLSGKLCTSVTKFVDKFFPAFDSERVSKETAERRGCTQKEILDEWSYIRVRGTHIHETCEDILNERAEFRFKPDGETEQAFFDCAKATAAKVKEKLKSYQSEMAMADVMYNLAGTTDLVGVFKNPQEDGSTHLILDWKTNSKLSQEAFGGKTGFGPCANIPDANWWHYALQLASYEDILKRNGYVESDTKFKRVLVHFWMNPIDKVVKPKYYLTPDLHECVEAMLRSDLWRK